MKKYQIPILAMAISIPVGFAFPADAGISEEGCETLALATQFAVHADWAAQLRHRFLSVEGASIESVVRSLSANGQNRDVPENDVRKVVDTFFDADAKADWNRHVSDKLDALQLGDFFLGTQVWPGPADEFSAVLGFYNPWWDTLLVVKTAGGYLPVQEDASEAELPKVEKFVWVSGETLRKEPSDGMPSVQTAVPGDLPLSVSLWRAQTGALRRFDGFCEGCNPNDPDSFPWEELPDVGASGTELEWNRIEARSAARLRLYALLADENAPVRKAMAIQCRSLLREGSRRRLRGRFTSPVHSFFVDTFVQLAVDKDVDFRKDFEIYGCVPGEEGTLFYFVNAEIPRLYATVTVPKGIEDDPDAGDVVFEWYDLAKADQFLAAWEEENPDGVSATRTSEPPSANRNRDLAKALNEKGVSLVADGDVSGGESAFRQALDADPGCGEAARNLAKLLFADGSFAEAHGILARAAAMRPEDVSILVPKAQAEAFLGLEAAFSETLAKIERQAEDPDLLPSFSVLLMGQESLSAAQMAAQAAARRPDAGAEAWFTLGLAEERLSHLNEAETAYRTALKADERHFKSWLNLGNVRDRLGDRTDASACYERALALDPDSALAQYNLGRILALHTDRIDEGVDLLVKAANGPEEGDAKREARRLLEFILSGTR